ncbi:MAG: hypothetical protein JNM56_05435 [Planctomycetia bacterium]|nr:hypothetical protein [Planctomycetia bacterium]
MDADFVLPSPEEILNRIAACRDELAALKRLLRAAEAAVQAKAARDRRGSRSRVKKKEEK